MTTASAGTLATSGAIEGRRFSVYLKRYAESEGHEWPEVCDYYSSFVKYGVHEPVVCWLLALGVSSRAGVSQTPDGRFPCIRRHYTPSRPWAPHARVSAKIGEHSRLRGRPAQGTAL